MPEPLINAVVALSTEELRTLYGPAGLEAILPGARYFNPDQSNPADWIETLASAQPEVLVSAWRTPPLPSSGPGIRRLRYVCHLTGSVRSVVPRELLAAGLTVTNWGNVAAPMVAEQALLLILGALRAAAKWPDFLATQFSHESKNVLSTQSLHGRRVSIHGFGRIARELVRLLRPFGVSIRAYSAGVPDAVYREFDVEPAADLQSLADGADVFVSCEALTDASRGSVDRSVFTRLPVGAVFVNVGRGAVVNEADLAAAALERNLRVALDVFTQEPLPMDSPLRAIPGAFLSPHIGGPTLDWYPKCGAAAGENLVRYLRGEPLKDVIGLDAYDRST